MIAMLKKLTFMAAVMIFRYQKGTVVNSVTAVVIVAMGEKQLLPLWLF